MAACSARGGTHPHTRGAARQPRYAVWMGLTHKQDLYARYVASGETQTAAYRASYDAAGMRLETVYVEASRLAANPKVALRIEALREAKWKQESLTRESVLYDLMQSVEAEREAGDVRVSLRGLEIAGKMLGMF